MWKVDLCSYSVSVASILLWTAEQTVFMFDLIVSPTTMEETAAAAAKIITAQPLATARQPTTSMIQSQTTAGRQETTIGTTQPATAQRPTTTPRPTTPRPTTQPLTMQRPTTQPMTTRRPTTQAQTTATETTTSTQPATTLQLTTSSVTAAAAPSTTSPTQRTAVSSRPTTFSAVMSLTGLTTHQTHQPGTTTRHTSLSPVRPTAGPTLAIRTTRPLDRKTTTLSKPTEKAGKDFSVQPRFRVLKIKRKHHPRNWKHILQIDDGIHTYRLLKATTFLDGSCLLSSKFPDLSPIKRQWDIQSTVGRTWIGRGPARPEHDLNQIEICGIWRPKS